MELDQSMNMYAFSFAGLGMRALPSGALWWPETQCLFVADLHLGKSDRIARRGGPLLPPYETAETLARLEADIDHTAPAEVICLGDSFDDAISADTLPDASRKRLDAMQRGRRWVWISGNHDAGGSRMPQVAELRRAPLVLRHIAEPGPLPEGIAGELSGHYHPKHRLATRGGRISRPCFVVTRSRVILPAYGTYTGGLDLAHPAFAPLLDNTSQAIMTGTRPVAVPLSFPAAERAQ